MAGGEFQFEDCLLKHYIRRDVWLPRCKERLRKVHRPSLTSKKKTSRRLKYFTFCAVGALDVLLLDREKILRRSSEKEFDTVFFFDRDEDSVVETRKRIPGAIGFPGDFVKVVLDTDQVYSLDAPEYVENTMEVRELQLKRAQYNKFVSAFPFDVINLDIEQYLFKPKEQLPGKLMTVLRKMLDWQKRECVIPIGNKYFLDEFTLMFTTQVGPSNLPKDYLLYLRETCLQQNLDSNQELRAPFAVRSNERNVASFFEEDFASAFKLAVPKSLIELALEADWYIDGARGIEVYEFNRNSDDGPYTMLHMAMTVRRQAPPKEQRGPGQKISKDARANHKVTIMRLFQNLPVGVEDMVAGERKTRLEADLLALFEHRKNYYDPTDGS